MVRIGISQSEMFKKINKYMTISLPKAFFLFLMLSLLDVDDANK